MPAHPDSNLYPEASGPAKALVYQHRAEQPLKLYAGWFYPFVQRVWLALEEKKIPYEYIEVNPYDKPGSLLRLNLQGLVPTLSTPAYPHPRPLYESTVILEYLEEAYPDHQPCFLPEDIYERARARIWIDYCQPADGSAQNTEAGLVQARQEFLNHLKAWVKETHTKGPFFLGEDISLPDLVLAPRSIKEITSYRALYLPIYKRYADNTAQRTAMARNMRDESPRGSSTMEPGLSAPAIHPSFIQVANPYIFEQTVENCIEAMNVNPLRETSLRLQGVAWIDSVRRALNLPIRTFDTAVGYYHRFRLVHPDNEYIFTDAAAAALFTACKIEDTLKKSRDIVCAAYNLKLAPSEHLSADDPMFESHARGIIGLERLMLEASGFDFRTRHPQKTLMKLGRHYGLLKNSEVSNLAYRISSDLYRTFAPIKQNSSTMAFSCLELAGRLLDQRVEQVESGVDYAQWSTNRAEIMETLFDLLELYTHHRSQTAVGSEFPADRFLTVRIPLNQEASEHNIPRYHPWIGQPHKQSNGGGANDQDASRPAHPLTPIAANGDRQRTGERGRDAAVRFMLDPACADEERRQVAAYFKVEMEEYEVDG
ncbi:Glutathione S-transferase/chloride channel C-terminal [Penicillium fimorum]|uniref:Glutathione S-transferase/chloride channel C-terminal n=1 Tax=Penicillium fimorum TaxID=1882269 RepID=A0A9W9Y0S2_9EURO|nr:Glutathione S-transferase/chloride channel C-terminal [Penicillium fimorum]